MYRSSRVGVFGGISVTPVLPPPDSAPMSKCTVTVNSTRVQCALPAGHGRIIQVVLTVLDQTTSFDVDNVVYDSPVVTSSIPVAPIVLASDVAGTVLTLVGSGFGAALSSLAAWYVVDTGALCGSSAPFSAQPVPVSYQSDAAISLSLQPVVLTNSTQITPRNGSVVVTVGGQYAVVPVTIAAPTISTLTLDSRSDAGVFIVNVAGSNFGGSLGSQNATNCWNGGVSVVIDGAPCLALHMLQPHTLLQCVTDRSSGVIVATTAAGSATKPYTASSLTVIAVVTAVSPQEWSTASSTILTINGTRYVVAIFTVCACV